MICLCFMSYQKILWHFILSLAKCCMLQRKEKFVNLCFQGELVPVAFVSVPSVSSFTSIFIKVGGKSAGVDGEFSRSHSKFWSISDDKPRIDLSDRSGWFFSSRIGLMGWFCSIWESNDMPRKNFWLWKCSRHRKRRMGILHRSYIQTKSQSVLGRPVWVCV